MIIIKSYYYIFDDANVKQFSRPKIILFAHFNYLITFCYKNAISNYHSCYQNILFVQSFTQFPVATTKEDPTNH